MSENSGHPATDPPVTRALRAGLRAQLVSALPASYCRWRLALPDGLSVTTPALETLSFRCWCIVCAVLLQTACAVTPPSDDVSLARAATWAMTGKLGIRSPLYSGSLGLSWTSENGGAAIRLTGPLGITVATIERVPGGLNLTTADAGTVFITEPELGEYLGYPMPLHHLSSWVRGVPDQATPFRRHGDGFSQAGWRVVYSSQGIQDPARIRLSRKDTTLTLVIRRWTY